MVRWCLCLSDILQSGQARAQSWCACKLPGLGGLWSWEVEKGSAVALCLS